MMLVSGDVRDDGAVRLQFYDPGASEMLVVDGGRFLPYFFTVEGWHPPASVGVDPGMYTLEPAERLDIFSDGASVSRTLVRAPPSVYGILRNAAKSAGGGGGPGRPETVWEGNIRHIDSYYYDRDMAPGRFYDVYEGGGGGSGSDGADMYPIASGAGGAGGSSSAGGVAISDRLEKAIIPRLRADRSIIDPDGYEDRLRSMASTLSEPIPEIKRCAVDIEIDSGGRSPDPSMAEHAVTAVGIHSAEERTVLLLGRGGGDGSGGGNDSAHDPRAERRIKAAVSGVGDVHVAEYGDEAAMLRAAFGRIAAYPCMLTYYGDEFDMPYMYNRATRLGIGGEAAAAFEQRGSTMRPAGGRIHIDLYRVFSNPSLHAYAFSGRYNTFGLGAVSEAMLGERKTGSGAAAHRMDPDELARYCHHDARLTYELSAYSDGIVMRLLVTLARLSTLSVDAVSRTRVSTWIQSMMRAEHRRRGALIPTFSDLQARLPGGGDGGGESGSGEHRTKKYKGATVLEQTAGVYWGLTVLDFASMYPNIIHSRNLSYETVRCGHPACRDNNRIDGTDHWHCTERAGMLASIIGAMREMRVRYYKPLARDESLPRERRDMFGVIEQAIKVVMNASYGVMGSDMFAMYFLPVAESTTAIGRQIISGTASDCEKRGMRVLYGDTDSLFLGRADQSDMDAVIAGAKERHGADLEVDKQYRFAILTGRKKNYLGVRGDGTCDIKGLTGKKSHTPPFVRDCFGAAIERLAGAADEAGIEDAKRGIVSDIEKAVGALRGGDVPIRDLLFRVKMTQDIGSYGGSATASGGARGHAHNHMLDGGGGNSGARASPPATAASMASLPQHVKAAVELQRRFGADIRPGDVISYVKSTRTSGVSPYECAAREDVDSAKYTEFLASTLDQLLRPLGIDAGAVIGGCGSSRMEEFFG